MATPLSHAEVERAIRDKWAALVDAGTNRLKTEHGEAVRAQVRPDIAATVLEACLPIIARAVAPLTEARTADGVAFGASRRA